MRGSAIPLMTRGGYPSLNSGTSTPTVNVPRFRSQRASRLCWELNFPAAAPTRLPGLRWDRTPWDIVEHHRNRGGAEAEIVRQNLQADGFIGRRLVLLPESHG